MKLFWIDCETTGLDPEADTMLEIAVSVADLVRPFEARPVLHHVFAYPESEWRRVDPKVAEMHRKSGLRAECAALWRGEEADCADVDAFERALGALVPEVGDYEGRPVVAGSSAHFDLSFLRAEFPGIAGRFSHRIYDVSAVKLFCRSLGMPKLPRAEAHRAREDVRESVAHARECARWLSNAQNAMRWWPMVDPKDRG